MCSSDLAPSSLEVAPPATSVVSPATPAVSPLPLSGSDDFGICGTLVYDKYPVAGTLVIKASATPDPTKTFIYSGSVRDIIKTYDKGNHFGNYEAFRVSYLNITFQKRSKWLSNGSTLMLAYSQDPYRETPFAPDDQSAGYVSGSFRYQDITLVSPDGGLTWQVPVPKNTFYTILGDDRRRSDPGNVFIRQNFKDFLPWPLTVTGEV